MRIVIVYHSPANSDFLKELSLALTRGIESRGYSVTLIDARKEPEKTLTGFDYIAFGLETHSLFAKNVSDSFKTYLASAGMLAGKRCYAFVTKKGVRRFRLLASLMSVLESEAMYIKRSDVLSSKSEAESIGRSLRIEKST